MASNTQLKRSNPEAEGIEATAVLTPNDYLAYGPLAWLALMVMPLGWLGPIISLNLMKDRTPELEPQF